MKPQTHILKSIVAIAIIATTIASCKKREEAAPTNPATTASETSQQTLRASDQSAVDNESNQAMDDINSALNDVSTTRDIQNLPCGSTLDTLQLHDSGFVMLNFDGITYCAGRKRAGQIKIQLPFSNNTITPWHVQNCVVMVTFRNYKVTNLVDNKSVVFNGIHKIKNVSGGGILELLGGTSIAHQIRAEMQITFDDGTQRTWHVARLRYLSFNNNMIKCTLSGDTTMNGYTHITTWGINRAGEDFSLDVPTPVSFYITGPNCLYKPIGQVVHHVGTKSLTITYGVDSGGIPVTGGACPYGYKLEWTDAQNTPQHATVSY